MLNKQIKSKGVGRGEFGKLEAVGQQQKKRVGKRREEKRREERRGEEKEKRGISAEG